MKPILFQIPDGVPLLGGQAITSFGVMVFLGFLAAAFVHRAGMRRHGLDPDNTWDLLFWAVVGGVVGAKLYYLLLNWRQLVADPLPLLLSRAGLVWYGGFLGGLLLVVWQIHRRGLPLAVLADITAPALALGYGVGRVGCFLVGDDWGLPTGSWVGIRFPQGSPPTRVDVIEREFGIQVDPDLVARFGEVVPVHPTQLYETALSLVIFGILWSLAGHRHRKGWLFMLWLVLAGLERFGVEFFRAKDDRFFGSFTLAQAISLVMVVVGMIGMKRLTASTPWWVGRGTAG